MTYFYYKAINPETKMEVSDNIEADSPRAVREHVRSLGLLPVIIREAKTSNDKPEVKDNNTTSQKNKNFYTGANRVKPFNINDKIYFFSQLQIMFSAGLPITSALETLAKHAPKAKMRLVAKDIEMQIRNGETFTTSLKRFTYVFGETAVGLCLTAEAAGQLDDVMERIVEVLKKEKLVRSKVVNISIYPVTILIACLAMFFLCGLFVFPKLLKAFNVATENIPEQLSQMMNICSYCYTHWYIVLIAGFVIIKALIFIFRQPIVKNIIDEIAIKLPIIKDCVRYLNLSPFFAVLAMAYDGGLSIPSAIEMATFSISNSHMKKESKEVSYYTSKGETLSQALAKTNFVSPTFNMLIVSGENSGNLTHMFQEISENIDHSIDDTIAKLIEAMKFISIIIAGIAVLCTAQLLNGAINIPFSMF